MPAGTRVPVGLSAVLSGLAPGTYDVGLCARVNSAAQVTNWNSNEFGYTTATVLQP